MLIHCAIAKISFLLDDPRIICSHMLKHFEKYSILTTLNHGFCSGYSTETQLLVTMYDLLQANDARVQVNIAILDF